jgi:hypothetical protein
MAKTLKAVAATLALVFPACGGGGGSNPTPVPTPTPAPTTPAATPTPGVGGLPPGFVCDPTPPPLYGIHVKIHLDSGALRKTLDSRPRVINMDGYCGKAGFGAGDKFCWTRQEGDPQAEACDYLAMGRAADTGRWGPTWYWESKLCVAQTGQLGCTNHPDNQFLLNIRGDGTYEACAAPEIPLSTDPDRPGSRCGRCTITNSGDCQ